MTGLRLKVTEKVVVLEESSAAGTFALSIKRSRQINFHAFKKRCSGKLSQPSSESYFNLMEWKPFHGLVSTSNTHIQNGMEQKVELDRSGT